jgi:1,4-alpha-glucan branching enzyme
MTYIRKGHDCKNDIVVVCNLTPVLRDDYRIGLSKQGELKEIFNSDSKKYGGSGVCNSKHIPITDIPWNFREYSVTLKLPPLGVVFLEFV